MRRLYVRSMPRAPESNAAHRLQAITPDYDSVTPLDRISPFLFSFFPFWLFAFSH